MINIIKLSSSAALVSATAADLQATPVRANTVKRQITRIDPADCPTATETSYIWDTKPCRDSYFSPWTYPTNNWVNPPTVNITLAGVEVVATVDTGSTSLVASMALFPNNNFTRQNPTSVFYSSSHWLEEGYEEWIDMTFGPFYMRTQAIIKDREVCCPTFNSTTDGHRCPTDKVARNCECSGGCTSSVKFKRANLLSPRRPAPPPPVAYMGIGFGRGEPQIDNAFLDVATLNGQPITSSSQSYCPGYVITTDGIYLGLTTQNTQDFKFVTLKQQSVAGGQRDWSTPAMQYQIDQADQQNGTVLVDTGIPESFFQSMPAWHSNSTVHLSVPGGVDTYTVRYEIDERGKSWNPMQPTDFQGSPMLGFMNTGRHFLNCFDIMYDPTGGNYGFRFLGDTRAPNCTNYVTVN
ncbi:hypothetical protein Dda_2304 [Drechslerella dactyloides]|uniref:Uncharacterized protein n=1 Tax=Drechslerella dactyloides TaxID=74499 RepID=A0AAD6J546_DREDA|nr:hypothetical protein Dda_2304 [Drechslerella dactyloides]